MANSSENTLLKIEGVQKRFGPTSVLGGVSFDLQKKELVVLLGPNGCGKTTLLRIIAHLLPQDSGSITPSFNGSTSHLASIGLIFQHTLLLPWFTVEENILLPFRFSGIPPDDSTKSRLDSLMETAGLSTMRDARPAALSGGERRKVVIVRSLLVPPALLLLDEPFTALDYRTHRALQEYLLAIQQQTNTTFLFVTHDVDEAAYLADRIVVLSPSPSIVCKTIPVPLPREQRTYDNPDFKALVVKVLTTLRQ